MKVKFLIYFLSILLLLSGCSADSAKEHGKGISIEMSDSLNIKHMTLVKYVDGREVFSENVIHADTSAFEKGDITWFDVSSSSSNATVELAVSYSENLDGTNSKTTKKIDVSNAKEWINVTLTDNYELELLEMK